MIKKIAWNTFKQTGDIETYLELKQFERVENHLPIEDVHLGTGTKGMPINNMSIEGYNQDIFQANIERAVNNFWDNVNKT